MSWKISSLCLDFLLFLCLITFPSLPSTPSPPVQPVIVPLDHALPAESDRPAPERLLRDGLVTRSGRQVELTEKAKAAFQ